MSDETALKQQPWSIAILAILPGLIELAMLLTRIAYPIVTTWAVNPEVVLQTAWSIIAIGWCIRRRTVPVWALMPIGLAAVSLGPLLFSGLVAWLIDRLAGLASPGPQMASRDLIDTLGIALSLLIVLSAAALGFARYWRSSRPSKPVWALAALALVYPLVTNPPQAILAIYWLITVGLGLRFSRRHDQRAVMVLFGVLLAWMGILDIDYALAIYYPLTWVIDLYTIVWRLLVFVAAPLWLLRAGGGRRMLWGVVLPILAALTLETAFALLARPSYFPQTLQQAAFVLQSSLLNPMTFAFAIALLLYRQDYLAGQAGAAPLDAGRTATSPRGPAAVAQP